MNKLEFEDALRELEVTIKALEKGDQSLDVSLELFALGVSLSTTCHTALRHIESEMERLLQENEVVLEESLSEEEAFRQLEETVRELERGDGSLKEALSLFRKGVGLTCLCRGYLDQAEAKIEVVMKQGEDVWLEPLRRKE